ncbi:MAG TPA: hypothetical protein VHL53_10925 [Acidimicrobiia bacterium]|nr:hypothetical protein [Acidimicrobiia bacterium]
MMDDGREFETFDGWVQALRGRRRRRRLAVGTIVAVGALVGVAWQLPGGQTRAGAAVCHDSYDKRCGPFRWDPQPENGPLTVQISGPPVAVKAGQPVTFHVVVDDPDHSIDRECDHEDYGDEGHDCTPGCEAWPIPYGPWSPPLTQPDHYERDLTHTYAKPGTYAVSVAFSSGMCDPPINPYGSYGAATTTVTVTA